MSDFETAPVGTLNRLRDLEREARYHQQELDTLLAKLRESQSDLRSHVRALDGLQSERDALEAHQKALVFELSACQGVLHSLAHSGQVTREYADDAKAVLQRSPATSLARLKAEWLRDGFMAGAEHDYRWSMEGGYIDDAEEAFAEFIARRQAEGGPDDTPQESS